VIVPNTVAMPSSAQQLWIGWYCLGWWPALMLAAGVVSSNWSRQKQQQQQQQPQQSWDDAYGMQTD
jgi:anti-sigma factor RsiW